MSPAARVTVRAHELVVVLNLIPRSTGQMVPAPPLVRPVSYDSDRGYPSLEAAGAS
jgi:hypothetical protein